MAAASRQMRHDAITRESELRAHSMHVAQELREQANEEAGSVRELIHRFEFTSHHAQQVQRNNTELEEAA